MYRVKYRIVRVSRFFVLTIKKIIILGMKVRYTHTHASGHSIGSSLLLGTFPFGGACICVQGRTGHRESGRVLGGEGAAGVGFDD